MRNELETRIMNTLFSYRSSLPFEDIKAQITIILNDYEIEPRKTEIIVRCFITRRSDGRTNRHL